jgi:hypothetical protein
MIEARKRLDWRHRLKVISEDLEIEAPILDREMSELDDCLASFSAG